MRKDLAVARAACDDPHAKRVQSLANATLGVVRTASLAVHTIGRGLALARGLVIKHAVKQVDRLLSNDGIDIDAILPHWVHHVAGSRIDIKVAMDWTDFDADKQTTIMLSLMTGHGRATPLVWLTVDTATLKNHRNEYEYQVLVRLADMLPAGVKSVSWRTAASAIKNSTGCSTEELHFDYVIRFRGNIKVTAADGEERAAGRWVGPGGRATVLRGAMVTADVSGGHRSLRAGQGHEGSRGAWPPVIRTDPRGLSRPVRQTVGASSAAFGTQRIFVLVWAWVQYVSAPPPGAIGCGC